MVNTYAHYEVTFHEDRNQKYSNYSLTYVLGLVLFVRLSLDTKVTQLLFFYYLMRKNIKSSIIDPIHKNIPITNLESRIIDTRLFQRLRHVLQNSTAYQTYPANTNTRFPHSLGVMHIAGKMFLNALSHAPYKILERLLTKLNNNILTIEKELNLCPCDLEEKLADWADKPAFIHRPKVGRAFKLRESKFLGCNKNKKCSESYGRENRHSDYYLIASMYEAVRVGALVHDVGHMPLSHIFEDAIRQRNIDTPPTNESDNQTISDIFLEDSEKRVELYKGSISRSQSKQIDALWGVTSAFEFHELRGLFIFNKIVDSEKEGILASSDIHDKLITEITKRILISLPVSDLKGIKEVNQAAEYDLWGLFHSFFSNNFVDSDRLDYTMRDPVASGIGLAEVNLDLLYENISISWMKRKDGLRGHFFLGWHLKAIPTIEMFFHQRYLGYKYIAYHHSVMRTNSVAKKIIYLILKWSAFMENFPNISNVAASMGLYNSNRKEFFEEDNGIDYDDPWFRTLFVLILRELSKKETADRVSEERELLYLKLLLETYLHRKSSRNIFTLWKSESDFDNWHSNLIHRHYSGNKKYSTEQIKEKCIYDQDNYTSLIAKNIEKRINNRIEQSGINNIHVITERTIPKIYNPAKDGFPIVGNNGELFLNKLFSTPYIDSFRKVYETTPRLNIFILGENIKSEGSQKDLNTVNKLIEKVYKSGIDSALDKETVPAKKR